MPPPFFVWEFAFDWQEALLVPLPRRRGKPRRYKKANAPRTPIRNPRSAIRNSPPSPRRRGKPRRYKKANAFHAFLARVPIVPVLVPVPVHGVVLAKTSSSSWSGSIRALVYVNVYRFAVDVYGASRRRQTANAPPNPKSAIPNPQSFSLPPLGAGSRAATKRRMRRRQTPNPKSAIPNSQSFPLPTRRRGKPRRYKKANAPIRHSGIRPSSFVLGGRGRPPRCARRE